MNAKTLLPLLLGATMLASTACASARSDDDATLEKRPMSAVLGAPADEVVPFEGAGGPTGVGVSPAEDRAVAAPEDLAAEIGSNCSQSFPPPASLPCAIPEAGPVYYVSPSGSDASDGTAPERAWATLFHAVKAAARFSTIRVAAGQYTSAVVHVDRELVIKGGFDATFASWDPDAHRTVFVGALSLAHDHAIWGGFRLVTRGASETGAPLVETRHRISGGTFLRNYVEIAWRATANQHSLHAIAAAPPEGHRTRLLCNDVYVRGEGVSSSPSLDVRGVAYSGAGSIGGEARLSSNRICVDRGRGVLSAEAVGGAPADGRGAARVTLTNNLIEAHGDEAQGLRAIRGVGFSSGAADLDVVATNNTVYSETDGIAGAAGAGGGRIRWTLMNNVVFSKAGRDGVNVGAKGSSVVTLAESSGNLVFGFMHDAISPTPRVSTNDDTSGDWTVREVFGDARLIPRDDGPARRGAMNVFGDPAYGAVRTDVWSSTRPLDGSWTRGAVQ
ncbi:MAG: hypothetical protein KF795_22250 [Labilithrix sp.]|nr:hypothetical protein [Labilithrix sp.]